MNQKISHYTPDQFSALANSVPQLGWITDPQGELLWFNQQWYDYTGLTPEQSFNNGWRQAHHPDNLDKTLHIWETAMSAGKIYEVTYQLRRFDGIYRWFLTRAVPTFDDKGQITSWIGTSTDIDETKLAQNEIASIIDNVEEGFVAVDKDWNITQLNSYHEKRMGNLKKYKQIGRNLLDLHFSEPVARETLFYKSFLRVMSERISLKFEDYYYPLKVWVAVNVYPKADGGIAIFYRDITLEKFAQTELIRAKEESERANQLKTAFLANMSHEIRTPLASIMGFAEILKENHLTEKDKDRFLQMIIKNGASLSRIIDDILDLSKVEAGHLEVESVEMAFDHLLYEVLALFKDKANRKNIYLNMNLGDYVPTRIKSDPTRVRQILINLIGNAVKFTKDGGVDVAIHSETLPAGNYKFKVSIRDTGIGLTLEQSDKLFRPFTQADNSTTRKYGGTGLGLALSKHLAHALGGDIRITHSELGAGSIFEFEFIAQLASEEKVSHALENTHPPATIDLKNKRVLLAEDSPDSQELIKHILTSHGANVTVANDGAEALQLARTKEFDVVLMDIQMPEMDGYEVTRILRSEKFRKPIVALTAHAMLEERHRTKAAGCDAHITKPLNFRQLISTVYYIIQRSSKSTLL